MAWANGRDERAMGLWQNASRFLTGAHGLTVCTGLQGIHSSFEEQGSPTWIILDVILFVHAMRVAFWIARRSARGMSWGMSRGMSGCMFACLGACFWACLDVFWHIHLGCLCSRRPNPNYRISTAERTGTPGISNFKLLACPGAFLHGCVGVT
jgi:hypothetical protein